MEPFTTVEGVAAPLLLANIDTDVIIRIERLTGDHRDRLGDFALEALRYLPDGREDPDFVLNREPFRRAPILLTGPNFGCGSSREGAVVALLDRGVRVVIAPSFGDIFYGNCFQNGLLPIRLEEPAVERLAAEVGDGGEQLVVDLRERTVTAPSGIGFTFEIDPLRRAAMLEGLDDIAQTLLLQGEILAWQEADRTKRNWVWMPGSGDAAAASPKHL